MRVRQHVNPLKRELQVRVGGWLWFTDRFPQTCICTAVWLRCQPHTTLPCRESAALTNETCCTSAAAAANPYQCAQST